MGQNISRLLNEFENLRMMSMEEFQGMRDKKFASIVRHHYMNNEPYRKILDSSGISENNLPTKLSEIDRLPILEREWYEEVRMHQNPSIPSHLVDRYVETSGSIQRPLVLPYSKRAIKRGGELIARSVLFLGISPEERGYSVTHWYPPGNKQFPDGKDVWGSHYNIAETIKALDDRPIDESTQTSMPVHLKNIIESSATYSVSAPAFYIILAGLISKGEHENKIRKVTMGGSTIRPDDFAFVKDKLKLEKLILFYPTTESGIIGSQIDEGIPYRKDNAVFFDGAPYYIFADEIHMEILDDSGKHVKSGERGRVVATNFYIDSYPAIRYLQGDEATMISKRGHSYHNKFFPSIDGIVRYKDIDIGGGIISYYQIEEIPSIMMDMGVPVLAFQIAKQKGSDRRDKLIIRLETLVTDEEKIKEVAIKALKRNDQIRYLIDSGEIHEPEVSIFGLGVLKKELKVPIIVDESNSTN
jgi:phenylacetate-coenzyme A ligase PaaK-like adenylate-forming protein